MHEAFSVFRKIKGSPTVSVHGQVATKPHIVELMLDIAKYDGDCSIRVLDPGCGEGAFTVAIANRLLKKNGISNSVKKLKKCLLAVDKDPAAVDICRKRVVQALTSHGLALNDAGALAASWIVCGDFLESEEHEKFDLIVGNPPYVRQEAIPKEKLEKYREQFECFYDRADLYVAFFEKGLKLLAPNGSLAFICPDRFAKNKYGQKLRAYISAKFSVDCVVDLAQASPFVPDVTCYPGIFVIRNNSQAKHVDYYKLSDANQNECQHLLARESNGRVIYHRYDEWFKGNQQWSIESPEHLALLRRLEKNNIALGDEVSGCRVGIGVATGADSIFILDKETDWVESDLLMPLVTTRDIATGSVRWSGQCVINPFIGNTNELIDLKKYPRAKKYFQEHSVRLQGRNVAKRDQQRWYRTIDRIYPALQKLPKLLIPDIKAENIIVYESGRYYPHHNLYYIASTSWDLQALGTILRSSLGKFFIWMYGVKMRGNFLRFQAQYLRRICVPSWEELNKSVKNTLISAYKTDDLDAVDSIIKKIYGLSTSDIDLMKNLATHEVNAVR